MLKDRLVVLTEEEFEALEARKPQVPAEVIARTQGALIGWQNADEFDTEELQEHGDVLRDATRALLAAVEAAPEVATPDFDAMTPNALRDWLDERGRREGYENRSGRWYVLVRERNSAKKIADVGDQPSEPAALLALCQKIAAEEAS